MLIPNAIAVSFQLFVATGYNNGNIVTRGATSSNQLTGVIFQRLKSPAGIAAIVGFSTQ